MMKINSFSDLLRIIPEQSKDAILSSLSILPENLRIFLQNKLETDDPLVSDPVFEPMFSYEPANITFGEIDNNLIPKSFINILDKAQEYKFSKNMYPYKHQILSWETLLKTDKSIVVSSGTGSGKTECFMIPIISDMVKQIEQNNTVLEGVQALFIYPLNALIQNQKERFREWTKPYNGKIRFCMYNGLLPQNVKQSETDEAKEEIIDREHLWDSPSPLLITNTTMLEYMLIRANDKKIINKSKGKLKYIVLDEAHTYIGSQAAELSLLLKRVMNAFNVSASDVHFIATSATIGSTDAEDQLKKFLSSISGVKEEQIEVIFGHNKIDKISGTDNSKSLKELYSIDDSDILIQELRKNKFACDIRNFFINNDYKHSVARSLDDLKQKFKISNEDILKWLDILSVNPIKESSFLPLRLHLFHKTFPGIWTCCDPNCPHKDNIPDWKYGKIYLKERCTCDCGAPVFRVIACPNCGHPILEAQIKENQKNGNKYLLPKILNDIDEFSLDDDDSDISRDLKSTVYIDNTLSNCYISKNDGLISINNKEDAIKIGLYEDPEDIHCCNTPDIKKCFWPMQGAPFFLSSILPTLLNYAEKEENDTKHPHYAQKMICFTDSRQGTARLAVKLQQNAERNSFRSILLHTIALIENNTQNSEEISKLKKAYEITKLPDILNVIKSLEKNNTGIIEENTIIKNILEEFSTNDLQWIYEYYSEKDSIFNQDKGKNNLIEILFCREFARRPKKSVNMETLGLVATKYDFSSITKVPDNIAKYFDSDLEEWENFLKIIIDFYIRAEGYIRYPENWDKWGAIRKKAKGITFETWPQVKKGRNKQIINLLSYALDLDLKIDFHQDIINQIMKEAWNALTSITKILSPSTNQEYSMNLCKIGLQRPRKIFICPITNKALDVVLKGYSPYSYKKDTPICQTFNMPIYDFNKERGISLDDCYYSREKWLTTNNDIKELKRLGIWSNISSSIILGNRYYRTAEHSAQQEHSTLKRYEKNFKEGKINVLNCSTTMEMGVDIGGITISTMNNVPPHPANYLQRAGRAGRRKETKAVCFTLCKDNQHDQYVFNHPKWAFQTEINAPYVDRYSFTVLQRHINSLLLSYFFEYNKEKINDATKLDMEWLMLPQDNNKLKQFEYFCSDALRTDSILISSVKNIIKNTHFENLDLNIFIPQISEQVKNIQKQWFLEYNVIQDQKKKEKDNKLSLKAIQKREKRLLREYLLKELIEYGLLPRYGFPINIVTFDNQNRNNIDNSPYSDREDNLFKRRDLPSRDITTALREYAPGSDVVIDGLVYKSAGITLNWHIPASNSDIKEIQSIRYIWRCKKCGASGTSSHLLDVHCDVCGEEVDTKSISKYIEPAGFAVDFNAPVSNDVSTQKFINICEPLVTAHSSMHQYLGLPYIKYKSDEQGSLINYSKGDGDGYILCLECGKMVANNEKNRKDFKNFHYRLRSSANDPLHSRIECHHSDFSIVDNISLGTESKTDVLELILSDINGNMINNKTLAYSLAVAIRSGIAKFMNIENDEIGCITKEVKIIGSQNKGYSIELFDKNASGYCSSKNLIENLDKIFILAKNTLNCDCKQACNKCILQNDTKYNYNFLDRKIALEFLSEEWLKKNTLLDSMKIFGESTIISTSSIENAIEDNKETQILYLMIPDSAEEDDFINSPIYRLANRCSINGIETNLCINKDKLSDETKEILYLLSKQDNIRIKILPENYNTNILSILYDGIKYKGYASFDEKIKHANKYWGNNKNTSILSGIIENFNFKFSDIKLTSQAPINYDKMYEITSELNNSYNEFGDKLLEILKQSIDPNIKDSSIISICYKDRYLKSPLTVGLFSAFIKSLKEKYINYWNCSKVQIETLEITENSHYFQNMFYNDWDHSEIRNNVLKNIFNKLDISLSIKEFDRKKLEHNRIMEIILANGKKIKIVFDQGFSYWRCVPYNYNSNLFIFNDSIEEQSIKIINELPNVVGDSYPTRIFCSIE